MHQMGHRLEEGPQHLTTLMTHLAHHLELFVDHHEELVDLLLISQEVEQTLLALISLQATQPEGARDGIHPHLTLVDAHVPLGRGADQEAITRPEAKGPVGTALALQQPTQHRQSPAHIPISQLRPIVATDHEIGALTLTDLLADDLGDGLGVRPVIDLEAAAIFKLGGLLREYVDHLVQGDLMLDLDAHDRQRGIVVVGLEAALSDLPEGHRSQVVKTSSQGGRAFGQLDVFQQAGRHQRPAQHGDRVAVSQPHQGPRLLTHRLVEEAVEIGADHWRLSRRPRVLWCGGRRIGGHV